MYVLFHHSTNKLDKVAINFANVDHGCDTQKRKYRYCV